MLGRGGVARFPRAGPARRPDPGVARSWTRSRSRSWTRSWGSSRTQTDSGTCWCGGRAGGRADGRTVVAGERGPARVLFPFLPRRLRDPISVSGSNNDTEAPWEAGLRGRLRLGSSGEESPGLRIEYSRRGAREACPARENLSPLVKTLFSVKT